MKRMKRTALWLVALVALALHLAPTAAHAQDQPAATADSTATADKPQLDYAQEGFRIGLRGVPMLTFLQNAQDADNANLTQNLTFGYSAGLMMGQNFTPHSGFELHALYGIMGQRYTLQATPDSSVDLQTTLQYIKIPVLYRYIINPSSRLQFYAAAGAQLSIRMGAYQSINGTKVEAPEDATREFQDFFYETDLAAVAQLGLEYRMTENWSLNAYAHFEHSLIDMEDKVLKDPSRGSTFNMGVGLGIGVSYLFVPKPVGMLQAPTPVLE